MERLFDLDFQLVNDVVLLAIAMFFLFLIMSNKLFNPARKLLQDRKDGIARDIADAKKDKEEAEKLRLEYEAKLKDINKERDAILAEARQKALKNETKIINIRTNCLKGKIMYKIAVIGGDGIGNEVMEACEYMLDKLYKCTPSHISHKS